MLLQVNNCIGALNLRWFLLFLLCNFLLCSYGEPTLFKAIVFLQVDE